MAQVVAFYLVTCPAANMIGIYYQPLVTIAHETGLSLDDARGAIAECSLAGFAYYDEDAEMVWVPNMASYQIGDEMKSGDKRRGAVLAELDRVDGHRFADEFRVTYGNGYGIEGAPKGHARGSEGVSERQEAPSKDMHDPREETETETETEKGADAPAVLPDSPKPPRFDFDAIYERYPLKKAKAEGFKALHKLVKSQKQYDAVLAGVTRYAAEEEAYRRNPGKEFRPAVPHFSTWVNQKRWEDYEGSSRSAPTTPKSPSLLDRARAEEQA